MQETELENNLPTDILSSPNYRFEPEKSTGKKRVGLFINRKISYIRRADLEESDSHLIIVDLNLKFKFRVISLYRSFRPPGRLSPIEFFKKQITIIEKNITPRTIVLGDFNLDASKQYRQDYAHSNIYDVLSEFLTRRNLFQLVDFPTWSRTVNNIKKESILDHVYVSDTTLIDKCYSVNPLFGDHVAVVIEISSTSSVSDKTFCRDWRSYSPIKLNECLAHANLNFESNSVQEYWNSFENVLINVVDKLAPLTFFESNLVKNNPPGNIKCKINKRKRWLRKIKLNFCPLIQAEIKKLNKEIKSHFFNRKATIIRKKINSNNKGDLWKAVKIAKNKSTNDIPSNLTCNNIEVDATNVANTFAGFFHDKIETIKNDLTLDQNVYNGKNKLLVVDRFFMKETDIYECLATLKSKCCEGYDRIPSKVLSDAREALLPSLTALFRLIYDHKTIPEQWKISKVIPIFKKGCKSKIENYRPVANLCSTSKLFEKLILKQIQYLENINKLDFTGKQQHGFKKSKSTATAGLLLQSIISRAADDDNYVLMASLDLSAAFDLVNVELLLKRLRLIGLPNDLVNLIKVWLSDRKFYVDINGQCSALYDSDTGTVQGSVLGPILYAIFVSPIFDLSNLTNFADDNFIVVWNKQIGNLIVDLEKELEMIVKWLKDSGLRVNTGKTEICLFHRNDQPQLTLNLMSEQIQTKKSMNVLGVIFDCKLDWHEQVANAIKKSNKSLFAIKMISKFFTSKEIKILLDSFFYSVLYYNSEIWLLPSLNHSLKQQLMSASANALRSCNIRKNPYISFIDLHKHNYKSTPEHFAQYKLSLLLFKSFNSTVQDTDWVSFVNQIVVTGRQTKFFMHKNNKYKIGLNIITNRFHAISNKIELDWLNLSYPTYKYEMKKLFLPYN